MAAESLIERSFSGGEIAPALYARVDHTKYTTGLRACRNHLCMRYGGTTQRPGTEYVGSTFNGGNPVRLIPFIYNETGLGQSYILEFGNGYIAFYQNGDNVINAELTVITSITQANPCVITVPINLTGILFNTAVIQIVGVQGMTQLNNNYYKVANLVTGASSSFSLNTIENTPVDSSTYSAFTGGGTIFGILILITPYQQADLPNLQYAQSADIVTIVNQNYPIYELQRIPASPYWQIVQQNLQDTGPIIPGAPTASGGGSGGYTYTYYVSGVDVNGVETAGPLVGVTLPGIAQVSVTNPIVVQWLASTSPNVVSYNIYLNYGPSGNQFGIGYIGSVTTLSFTDPGNIPDYTRQPPVLNSTIGVGAGNYPSTVGFVQQRRFFGNTINNNIGFWGSMTGVYNNFNLMTPQTDASPIFGSIASEEVNAIEHLLELKYMLMFTSGAEIYVQGNGTGVVTPSAINASTQSSYGCSPLKPLKVGDVVLFNQALGSFIRDFVFDFVIDGYRGNDITMFSSHLFEGYQIVDWAYQKTPDSIIWAVRSDGVLLSCTYIREQQILAWARHDFTNGFVKNVSCIPENGDYAVYLSIQRTINGTSVNYIERMSSRIWKGSPAAVAAGTANAIGDPIDAQYLDANILYDGRNTQNITMNLTATTYFIEAGINDGIDFFEPSEGNVNLRASITPGNYATNTALATAVGVAMSAVGKNTYVGSIVAPGVLQISATAPGGGNGVWLMNFSPTGSPYTPGSAGTYLGFQPVSYSVSGGVVAPIGFPNNVFAQGPTAYLQVLELDSEGTPYFTPQMVGDQIFMQDEEFVQSQGVFGNQVKLTIQTYIDSDHVFVTPSTKLILGVNYFFTKNWAHAVQNVNGLSYLAGQNVSVWADRFVVGSPLNITVTKGVPYIVSPSGTLTLDKCYSVIYVGLPMTADFETLAIDTTFGDSILGDRKSISQLIVYLYNSRGFFGGTQNPDTDPDNLVDGVVQDPLFRLTENKAQANRQTYDQAPPLMTESQFTNIDCNWDKEGRIFIRNVDPVPLSILAVVPAGLTPATVAWSQKI